MIGSELVARRRAMRMTRAELARALEVDASTLYRWEHSTASVPQSNMLTVMMEHLQREHEQRLQNDPAYRDRMNTRMEREMRGEQSEIE